MMYRIWRLLDELWLTTNEVREPEDLTNLVECMEHVKTLFTPEDYQKFIEYTKKFPEYTM